MPGTTAGRRPRLRLDSPGRAARRSGGRRGEAGEDAVGGGEFLRAVQDLAVYQDRLYLAYGGANEDLGDVIAIGFRYFASAQDPQAVNELDSDEQQLVRYRALGERLFMAGVDPIEEGFVGNVYFRAPQSGWVKRRALQQGV
ncbi:MAG: hypothetical protein HY744_18805 [Deltaproteobacteria bacterium]|nr:hypothetical protein [Deltaproteobacteria bacterium]